MSVTYVNVIPLTRLPAHLHTFVYEVPLTLVTNLIIGQLVRIPFRQSEIFGLVLSFSLGSAVVSKKEEVKTLIDIVNPTPFLSPTHLSFLITLASWYGTSLGTLAKMSLLPLQKRKLLDPHLTLESLQAPPPETKETVPQYHLYQNEHEHMEVLCRVIHATTLILLPEVHLIDTVRQLLPVALQQRTVVWHSQLSEKQQFERWLEIRNCHKTIILSTRGGVLLPIPHLDTIIIDYEHDENHKHWDQTPRFHAKDVATLRSRHESIPYHLMSYSPSVESYFFIHKGQYEGDMPQKKVIEKPTRIIDMREERRAGRYGVLADELKESILRAQKDVFLLVNRLGFSTSVGCNDCGWLARCRECALPLIYHEQTQSLQCHYCRTAYPFRITCPQCKKQAVELRGAGTEFIEQGVHKLVGKQLPHSIIRFDSEQKTDIPIDHGTPRIVIGTDMAFNIIRWPDTELVAWIDIDRQLALPEYRADEQVWHTVHTIQYYRSLASTFTIQTFDSNHLIFRSLSEPDRFYRTDLNARRSFNYPPYHYLVRYLYGHKEAAVAKDAALSVYERVKKKLTTERKNSMILQPPIEMQPRYFRRQYWYVMLARLNPRTWMEDLRWLNEHIPPNWKRDPNPISLLSP